MFEKVAIVGVGLIGGSFGQAIKKHGLARKVVGVARRRSTLDAALVHGCCDVATDDLHEAATNADFVFLSPPVGQMKGICEQISSLVAENALVTDAGSTKAQIVSECEPLFGERAHFIGGHPMAGSEKTGPEAARDNLFENATWILTPNSRTNSQALQTLTNLVEILGAKPLSLSPQRHDELLAVTSHLPHVSAAALVHCFLNAKKDENLAALVAGGWRDSTRVAAGSPEMWRDIALANRTALLDALADLDRELNRFSDALEQNDEDAIFEWFNDAAIEREKF